MPDSYSEFKLFSRPEALNNFSHWFPKVQNCGMPVPKSVIVPVPDDLWKGETFYMEHYEKNMEEILAFTNAYVLPAIEEAKIGSLLFLKNATYSGKFDAGRSCFCMKDRYQLAEHIAQIMYDSLCCEAGGTSEVVIRERITRNLSTTPCIYNGLPLRPEFRVFYAFDAKKPIFTANYWDYDYVAPHLYEKTDRIVFNAMREAIEDAFEAYKDTVTDLVSDAMSRVEGLSGPWSVDVMLEDYPSSEAIQANTELLSPEGVEKYVRFMEQQRQPKFWLIDMALAERSSYWENRPGRE